MKLFILLIVMILSGCASPRALVVEKSFHPYYDKFETLYGVYPLISISMRHRDHFKKTTTAGHCYKWDRIIHINEKYWKQYSRSRRIVLVFHELGHCLFKRPHDNRKFSDGCPMSIMNEKVISHSCFLKREDYYYQEFPNE